MNDASKQINDTENLNRRQTSSDGLALKRTGLKLQWLSEFICYYRPIQYQRMIELCKRSSQAASQCQPRSL